MRVAADSPVIVPLAAAIFAIQSTLETAALFRHVLFCVNCHVQSRPVDEFMEDFEQQEKLFKEEAARAKERNVQKKASLHLTRIMHAECSTASPCVCGINTRMVRSVLFSIRGLEPPGGRRLVVSGAQLSSACVLHEREHAAYVPTWQIFEP